MKKRGRKQYSAELKAKIAVEAVKGQRTTQEIASHYEVHPEHGDEVEKASTRRRIGHLLQWPSTGQ